jgi:glutathione S-transferase
MTIKVHHLNNSRSQRVLWLLEEIEAPYEVIRYERLPSMLAPPELKRIHPLGKSPVIEDDGFVLAETGAIIQYLTDKYAPALMPERWSETYYRYLYWLHYAEGSAMPPLLLKLVIGKMGVLGWPARKIIDRMLANHLDFIETELAKSEWFAGDAFTAADIMMSFPLEAAASRAGRNDSRPQSAAFLHRIHASPAYQRALEKGGPYAYA